ncbi:MAG: 50S ribosomal protein L11 methyltransferase [Deltaproteobacteria bacterium]|nr:50S ribosomal protein L11 methyltransferase [Deltaproteobacteria bacterium]
MSVTAEVEYSPPCSELFIYYLEGDLQEDPSGLKHFIGNWQEDGFSFLFFTEPSLDQVQDLVYVTPLLRFIDHYQMSYHDWVGDKVTPFCTDRFFISPPWDSTIAPSSKLRITLDPGVVFGTGAHPTTRDCIEALELAFQSQPVYSALDLGTGTGILAVAAARLGCQLTLAVDMNRLAAKTAQRNIRLNQLQQSVLVVQGSADDFIQIQTDLLIANIHYDVMKRLVCSGGFLKKSIFILSGLLRSEAMDIENRLKKLPVRILNKWVRDGIWYTYWGIRN